MSKLSGVIFVLAGVGIAAITLASQFDSGGESVSPQSGVAASTAVTGALEVAAAEQPKTQPVARPEPPVAAQPPIRPFATTTERVATSAVRVPQPGAIAGPPLDRAGLTRELQRELKRVGCYDGDISGVWTPAVRRSMKTFTERANATLPVEQPDHILLAMVQNHQGKACGHGCPAGQGLADDGRCLPQAIIARGGKKHVPALSPPVVSASSGLDKRPAADNTWTAAQAPEAGRMALAGPSTEQAPAGAQAAEKSPGVVSQAATAAPADPATATKAAKPAKRSAYSVNTSEQTRRKRAFGAWIFPDAPVDRVLGRR